MVLAPPGRGLQFEKQSRLNQSISVYHVSTLVKVYIEIHWTLLDAWKQQKGSPLWVSNAKKRPLLQSEVWWTVVICFGFDCNCPLSKFAPRSNLVIGFIHFSGVFVDTPNGNSKQKRIKAMHWLYIDFGPTVTSNYHFALCFSFGQKSSHCLILTGPQRPALRFWWVGQGQAIFPWECQARFWNECLAISCNLDVCQPWGMILSWSIMKEFV